jgi:integrase
MKDTSKSDLIFKDQEYRNYISKSDFIINSTKKVYLNRLNIIQKDIWLNCNEGQIEVGKNKCLDYIIKHPEAFMEKLTEYVGKTKGRLANNLSIHSKNGYVTAILAVFRQTPGLMHKYSNLYKQWVDIQRELRKPINEKYMENKPDIRQLEAYVSFEKLESTRDKLPEGDATRLLLSIYTMIPPARSDYDAIKIYTSDSDKEKNTNSTNDDTLINYMILPSSGKNAKIVLQKYKTHKQYGDQTINLPNELVKEIQSSLDKNPREYLFVSAQNGKPFNNPNSFNRWANRELKKLFNKKNISLTTLRHIYISNQDFKGKTRGERNKLAQKMMHSVDTQDKYRWIIDNVNTKN